MRILVAVPDETEAGQLANVLKALGHEVRAARDERGVATAVREQSSHLVILSATAPNEGVLTLARVAGSAACQPHVLFLHSTLPDDFLAQVFEAGVDAEIRRPLTSKYFGARLAAIQRKMDPKPAKEVAPKATVAWAGDAQSVGFVAAAPAAHAVARTLAPIEVVARSAPWTGVLDNLQVAAGRFLTMGVSRSEIPAEYALHGLGASIVLLSAATQLELRLSVGVEAKGAEGLAAHLFGEGGDDLAQEVLNELSNIFMGTMKTSLSDAAHAFTGGLPQTIGVELVLRPASTYRFQESALFTVGDARIVVFAGLRSRANVMLTPGLLKEGMVLAKDVLSGRGVLLLNGGTRLSANMVERLKSNVAPKQEVEVIAP